MAALGEGLRFSSHGGKAEIMGWRNPSLIRARRLILHQRGADAKQVSAVVWGALLRAAKTEDGTCWGAHTLDLGWQRRS